MLRNNKGSILVVSLVVFSIISVLCLSCVNLIRTNSNIIELECIENKMSEDVESCSELAKSNVYKYVIEALSDSVCEEKFYEHFLGNNAKKFIKSVKKLSPCELKNVSVEIVNNKVNKINDNIVFEIVCVSKNDNCSRKLNVDVLIKNPFKDKNIKIESSNMSNLVRFYNYRGV